jgi:xeroderma pigmentosum group C-complementing protein
MLYIGVVGEFVFFFGRGGGGRLGKEGVAEGDDGMGEGEDMGGGFLPEGFEEGEDKATNLTSGFFPVGDEDEDEGDDDALEVDHGEGVHGLEAGPAESVMSTRPKRKTAAQAKASSSRRRRRRNVTCSSDEEADDDDEEFAESEDG